MKSDKLTERITVRLSETDLEAVKKYAQYHRLDPSDVLRMGTVSFLRSQGALDIEEPKQGFYLIERGSVPAGSPIHEEESGGKRIQIPENMLPPNLRKDAYVLRVNGKSMEPDIPDGSYIIVVRKDPKPGDIVVGHVDGDGVTLKKYIMKKGIHLLRSINPHPRFRDIIPREKLEAQGVFHAIVPKA